MRGIPLSILLFAACTTSAAEPPPEVLVGERARGAYWNRPWPSDELLTPQGTVDLRGFPVAEGKAVSLGSDLLASYIDKYAKHVFGFGLHTPAFFRLTGKPTRLPASIDEPGAEDPVVLISLDGHRPRLALQFVDDASGDPFLADNLLVFGPREDDVLSGGATYVAAVTTRLARKAAQPALPPAAVKALASAGYSASEIAAYTIFTTQDVGRQADLLRESAEKFLAEHLGTSWGWREVRRLSYYRSKTPNGYDAIGLDVTFSDGATDTTWVDDIDPYEPFSVEVTFTGTKPWSFRAFEGRVPIPYYAGLANRPFARPGVGLIGDIGRDDGTIRFAMEDGELRLISPAERDWARVLVQVPVNADGSPRPCRMWQWDHGTGGSAYSAINRPHVSHDGRRVAEALAKHDYCIASHDQPLFGQRYPLADEGYFSFLTAYNIVNATALRDYTRQTGVESWYFRRWIEAAWGSEVLPHLPAGTSLSFADAALFGHSLGGISVNLGLFHHREYDEAFAASLQSGSGGFFSLIYLRTAFIGALTADMRSALKGVLTILGAEPPAAITAQSLMGALMGIPEVAHGRIDDQHPIFVLFQGIADPGDPASFVRQSSRPVTLIMGEGDNLIPNDTTRILERLMPAAESHTCKPRGDYDPHYCTFVEPEGAQVIEEFAAGF